MTKWTQIKKKRKAKKAKTKATANCGEVLNVLTFYIFALKTFTLFMTNVAKKSKSPDRTHRF